MIDSVANFVKEHAIDTGLRAASPARRKTRQSNFRMFAQQLIALRRLGVVHGETQDGRRMALFLLNEEARRWQGSTGKRTLLAELCAIGGGADSMWTTSQPQVMDALKRLDLRSLVSLHGGERLALLVGPLNWLIHSRHRESRWDLLQYKFEDCLTLFEAAGDSDRRELLIRYDAPGSTTVAASVAQHPGLDDRKSSKRKHRSK